ncbi:MAG: hypothetical protein WCV59_05345 [Parcubacteria group bacterium]|jgi:capsular polysaccharide biosynthesis protein
MENNLKIKYFFAVAAVVAVICFAIFLNNNPVYRGEIEVLLIARNSVVDGKIDSLTETAKNIPLTLSFYDRVIEGEGLEDPSADLSAQERKAYWNSIIKTEKVDGSNIVKITAYDMDKDQAGKLADIYAKELSASLARYYNIKTQLDTRIIDQPITAFDFEKSVWPQAAKSIFWGVVAGILDILLFSFIPKSIKEKNIPSEKSIFTYKTDVPEKTAEPDYFPVDFSQKPEIKKQEKMITPEKKSAAPENLPFADEEVVEQKLYANGNGEKEKKEEIVETKKVTEDIFREATPEEVKERLNKLLSGKM